MNASNNTTTASSDAPLVDVRGLNIRYGRKTAVNNVSFTIPKGRVVGLLAWGPVPIDSSAPRTMDSTGARVPPSKTDTELLPALATYSLPVTGCTTAARGLTPVLSVVTALSMASMRVSVVGALWLTT